MDQALRLFLDSFPPHHESSEHWPIEGLLKVRLGLATALPPANVSSSVLAIVMRPARQVLYLWPSNPGDGIAHFLIGGRPEPGETPEQTAIRETTEETGWAIEPLSLIGYRHFEHLEARTKANTRPYPHFIQPIFAARVLAFDADRIIPADRIPAEFISFDAALHALDSPQRPILQAAIDAFTSARP